MAGIEGSRGATHERRAGEDALEARGGLQEPFPLREPFGHHVCRLVVGPFEIFTGPG